MYSPHRYLSPYHPQKSLLSNEEAHSSLHLFLLLASRIGCEACDPDAVGDDRLVVVVAVPGPQSMRGVDDVELAMAEARPRGFSPFFRGFPRKNLGVS
ncbi:hypothetical protein MA16_Dca005271 [Dendrobium catenatum]|uniref:Uncharacterized protein n=1 Tax=Dendrobium catenatum TaxID=906689 RepID=A0A2I0VLQ4_9ASPA|nr:hypothetical protein MA16_Dca005271 [Dendrobium catenatum]